MRVVSADVSPQLAFDSAIARAEREAPIARPDETQKTESPFAALVDGAIEQASALDARADAKVTALAAGRSDDIHGTMIATKEAEISVKLLGTIRNQLLDAFHEIWRTGV